MKLKYIFGRLTAYVPIPGLMDNEGDVAEFLPCEGQDFDLIFYDPAYSNIKQALLHEEIHALLNRIGILQEGMPGGMEEVLCEAISVFLTESYNLKEK